MVVPAMIDTPNVDGATSAFSAGPASRNDCGLTAITNVSTWPASFGLSRMPLAASMVMSADGIGSITTARVGSSPPASQPVSIAPPILPAPASAMVPVMFCKVLLLLTGLTTNTAVVPAKAGTHNHSRFYVIGLSKAVQALCAYHCLRAVWSRIALG